MKALGNWPRRALLAASFTVLLAMPTFAEQAPVPTSPVSEFTLGNGMQVVVVPDHRSPIVTHMVWYKVGSADEPPGKSGIAHFFEHLMFKATGNHAAGELDKAVADIGGNDNAFTSYDYTAFHETVPPQALSQMMAFEADRIRNLVLSDEVVATERDVVLEERRMRIDNDPQAQLDEAVLATLFMNQPYRIPVIGWMQEMQQLNRVDAKAFYDRYYAPNNAVLIVAGDVEAEAVRKLAEESFGKIPRGPDLPPRIRPKEPQKTTRRTVTLSDARVSVPSFSMQWVVPSYNTAKPGEAEAIDLLGEILGGGTRSRLYQELIVKKGIAASVNAGFQGRALDDSVFAVYATPRGEAKLADVEAAVGAEIERIARDGISAEELDRAKARYVRSMIFARDRQDSMANIYGSTLTTGGTVTDINEWPDRVRKVTAEEVKAAAARYLVLDRVVTGYLLPKTQAEN